MTRGAVGEGRGCKGWSSAPGTLSPGSNSIVWKNMLTFEYVVMGIPPSIAKRTALAALS